MKYLGSKQIETERLILRATRENDLKVLWQILCIPEVNKYYLTSKLHPVWEEELPWQMQKLSHANDLDNFCWSIVLKDTNECIGQITAQSKKGYPDEIRDMGWFINPLHQRQGYAYEGAKEVIKYMFKEVGISKILTGAAIANPASWKLMEKLGFRRIDGKNYFAKYTFLPEEVELYSYELTKEDFKSNK